MMVVNSNYSILFCDFPIDVIPDYNPAVSSGLYIPLYNMPYLHTILDFRILHAYLSVAFCLVRHKYILYNPLSSLLHEWKKLGLCNL